MAAAGLQNTAPAAAAIAAIAAAAVGPAGLGAAAVWETADAVWETVLRSESDSQPNLSGKVVW